MTVKELVSQLQTLPPDHPVVISNGAGEDDFNRIRKVSACLLAEGAYGYYDADAYDAKGLPVQEVVLIQS